MTTPQITTTVHGVDYSYGRPGGQALREAGAVFALRYLSNDPDKNLTHAEALDLAAHGVAVGVVWESTAQRALAGHSAGATDAATALTQARACGMPAGRPVYFAVDFDALAGPELNAVIDYFEGVNSVLPPSQTGVYGGYETVLAIMGRNLAHFGWQTTAWSNGAWYGASQLQQVGYGSTIAGVQCDIDSASGDAGLWHPTGSPTTNPPPPSSSETYTVKAGDTLSWIAVHLGVSLAALEKANPQVTNPNVIVPGQVLHIPGSGEPAADGTHTVVAGETLSGIAARFGVSLLALEKANPQIRNPNLIVPGQVVNIP